MKSAGVRRQQGVVLLAMLAVIMLAAAWMLVSQLNAGSGGAEAARKLRNADVLQRAKLALIGYVAAQAVKAGENNPGAIPCPEAPGSFNATNGTDGRTNSAGCTGPVVGRFPWRTIGTDQLVDVSGEPLWLVISAGWTYDGTNNSNINSNTVGQLTVDGVANDAVALIIAPGPAFNAPASTTTTGCSAWNQTRPTSGTLDWRNYLECENAESPADSTFVTFHAPNVDSSTKTITPVSNDQVIKITVADIMPAIEAAIANRIEREVLPALQSVFTAATWGLTGSNPVLPFATPWVDGTTYPGTATGAGSSSYLGVAGTYAGLLPFNQTQGCTVSATNPRCMPSLVTWTPANAYVSGSYGYLQTQACSWESTYVRLCEGEYHEDTAQPSQPIRIEMQMTFNDVAVGLRKIDTAWLAAATTNLEVQARDDVALGAWQSQTVSYSVAMNNGTVAGKPLGSVTITFGATLPNIDSMGWGSYAQYRIRFRAVNTVMVDHALLDSTDATTGWFVRNEWYRFLYYAVSPSNTASRLTAAAPAERSCSLVGDCLSLTTNATASNKSALLVLGGRAINGRARPSATLADYFEFGNTKGTFESQTVTPAVANIIADTGTANAYVIDVSTLATGANLQFRAANANTGNSTLNTVATGVRSLVNLDSSNLAAATIQANAAIQVTWDGTQFLLAKRPFNDRIAALSSN